MSCSIRTTLLILHLDNCYVLLYTVYVEGRSVMKLIISNSSPVPIYEQIKTSLVEQIIDGTLEENEPLPSIRNLAQDIRVSVLTVKKAYDELERDGYIVSIQGKGTFVATKNLTLIKEKAQKDIESHLETAVELAKKFEIDKETMIELIDLYFEEDL